MWYLVCLMSHNKERSAWKQRAAKQQQQHSYKLRMPCQLSALLTFPPPLSFSLMPLKNFQAAKMRRRDAGDDICQKTRFRKKRGRKRLIVCPSCVSLSRPSRVLLTCPPVTPLNKCQSLITISKVAETLKTIIMSVFPVALEKSLERGGGNSPSTLPSLLVQERKAQLGPTISTQLCCVCTVIGQTPLIYIITIIHNP